MKFEYIGRSAGLRIYSKAHQHRCWELVYNLKGQGITNLDGVQHTFGEGTVLLYPPGVSHAKMSDSGFEDLFVHFSGCDFVPKIYILDDDCDHRLLQILNVLYSTYYDNNFPSVCDSLFDVLMRLVAPQLDSPKASCYVQQLRSTIIQEFSNPDFRISMAMSSFPVNIDYLRRQFKQSIGLTPQEYLTQLRMESAKHLLADAQGSNPEISDVAYRVGYYDPLYFSRVFRKHTGVAPSKWK